MKKMLIVLSVYTVLLFGIVIILGYTLPLNVNILAVDVSGYKFTRGLLWFLKALPSILVSGFIVGCCVQWKVGSGNSVNRFSQAMMRRYKVVFIIAIVLVFFLTVCEEILNPLLGNKISQAKNNPAELKQDIILSRYYLNEDEPTLAWHYAELAYGIDPTDSEAQEMYAKTHTALEKTLIEIRNEKRSVEKIELPLAEKDELYTPKQLMEKSNKAMAEKNWFDAHYWATLAVKGSNARDIIHSDAIQRTNEAWNKLREAGDFNNDVEKEYFAKKKEGYLALNSGNFLSSYYIFLQLQARNIKMELPEDPDVTRYLGLSKEQLENQYFFIDETDDMDKMNCERDVFFSITEPGGARKVFYIGRSASVKQSGGFVRYMADFNMISYDSEGKFINSLHVPFAKGMAVSASYFDEESKIAMGIEKDMKYILEVQLVSVDRETEGLVSKPVIKYTETGVPESEKMFLLEKSVLYFPKTDSQETNVSHMESDIANIMFIPIEFDDFALITEVSHGSKNMNLLVLNNFISKSERYGYSSEVYIQSLVSRGSYPLVLLCIIVFAASLAWNYRFEDEDAVFKFRWIFFMPVLFIIAYGLFQTVFYVINLVNFVIVGMFGGMALIVAFVIYVIALVIISIMFLARKAD